MKAHIQAAPRCVLLWKFSPQDTGYTALAAAAHAYRLVLRPLTAGDLNTTIGDLCAGKVVAESAAPIPSATALPPQSAMIVSGLRHENGDLNGFISAVKKGGAEIPLRAMVTPTSKGWTLAALLAELGKEHEAVDKAADNASGTRVINNTESNT